MNVIDCAKMMYGNSELRAAVCDAGFNVLWKNRDTLPDSFRLSDFLVRNDSSTLSFDKETLLRFSDGSSARITPIEDGGERYYTVVLCSGEQIHELICTSSKLDELDKQHDSIRAMLTGVVLSTAAPANNSETAEEARERIGATVSRCVLEALSSNVNFGYMNRLLSQGLEGSYLSIDTQLNNTLACVKEILAADRTDLVCDIEPRVTGWCDYYFLEAAVLNLVINAHQYAVCMKKCVKVSLHCSEDKSEYIITVSDNGTAAEPRRIAENTVLGITRPDSGSHEGLGLQFVKRLCAELEGRLEFSASETGGLTVTMTLPRENSKARLTLAMEYHSTYNNIYDSCFCILAKGTDPTVYKITNERSPGRRKY